MNKADEFLYILKYTRKYALKNHKYAFTICSENISNEIKKL